MHAHASNRKARGRTAAPLQPEGDSFRVRIFVPFTQPAQTVVLTLDKDWDSHIVISSLMEHFQQTGVHLRSYRPYDYALRYEGPEDMVPVPKQVEAIDFPGMVLEKSAAMQAREQRLEAQRQRVMAAGWQAVEAREQEEAAAEALAAQQQAEAEAAAAQERQRQEVLSQLKYQRQQRLGKIEGDRARQLDSAWQKSQAIERKRQHNIKAYRERFVPRAYKRSESPRRKTPTAVDLVIGRLDDAIRRAQAMEKDIRGLHDLDMYKQAEPERQRQACAQKRTQERLHAAQSAQEAAEQEAQAQEEARREEMAQRYNKWMQSRPHGPHHPLPECPDCSATQALRSAADPYSNLLPALTQLGETV